MYPGIRGAGQITEEDMTGKDWGTLRKTMARDRAWEGAKAKCLNAFLRSIYLIPKAT